jgi:hypothetical protein
MSADLPFAREGQISKMNQTHISTSCNASVRGHVRTTWPPPWLQETDSNPLAGASPEQVREPIPHEVVANPPQVVEQPPDPASTVQTQPKAQLESIRLPTGQTFVPVDTKAPPSPPHGATIIVADEDAYVNEDRRGPPYMWTWLGASRWYYVREHPIPDPFQSAHLCAKNLKQGAKT